MPDGVVLMQAVAGGAAKSIGGDPPTQFTLGLPFPASLTLVPSSSFLEQNDTIIDFNYRII